MLMSRVDAYLRRTKIAVSRFGREAVGDPNFVLDLRDGREPRSKTVARVIAYINAREAELAESEQGR